METSIQIFNNPQIGAIRVAKDECGEPLFCLSDLCNVIGIANSRDVKRRLDSEDVEKSTPLRKVVFNQ
jgi:prophage antirepressor-like protein